MSVNFAVNTDTRAIPLDTENETQFIFTMDLFTPEVVKVDPVSSETGAANEKIYDFIALSSGTATEEDANVHARSVIVEKNISPGNPVLLSAFFNLVSNIPDLRLFGMPREQTDETITYDMFATYAGGKSVVTTDLTIVTLEVAPGNFPTLPTTPTVPIAADFVLREVRGSTRIYDIFVISHTP